MHYQIQKTAHFVFREKCFTFILRKWAMLLIFLKQKEICHK